ncbi:MAG: MASE4 domain-containing protein [Pseudolabrys sp.]
MARQGKDLAIWLSDIPATAVHRARSLAIIGLMVAAFVPAASFGSVRLPGNNAFIPIIQTVLFFGDLITAVLIYTKYSINRSRALLVLASGYFFTALIIVPHTLTFPNVFAPNGLLGPALQTTGWLHVIWHLAFPLAVIGYVVLSDRTNSQPKTQVIDVSAVLWSVVIVIGLVCAITWGLLASEDKFLPRLFLDRTTFAPLVLYTGLFSTLVCAIALSLLWFRRKSILDEWLAIAVFATLLELLMVTLFSAGRFDIGWYSVRVFSVMAATVVLLALLAETTNLYAKLARSTQALEQERDARLVTVEAATGAMAHEMRQPLSAIAASGEAGLVWLRRTPPNLTETSECLTSIVHASHSANEVISSVRRLFNTGGVDQRTILQVNDLIRETLSSLEHDLRDYGVSLTTELGGNVPSIHADRAQINQVLFNLFKNAIEAMLSCPPEKRSLRVVTAATENSDVSINIRDTGPGIGVENRESVFDPFFTTKQKGTGLGLFICRTIIERHGGKLRLGESSSRGTTFEISFPS